MSNYQIAFVGLGSIGKRHFINVCQLLKSRNCTYSIDLYRSDLSRTLPLEITENVTNQYDFYEPIKKNLFYDIVFVTNPTSLHYETIVKFKKYTASFFIEKPIFDSIDINESFLETIKNKISYVACPLRYNPVLQYVKSCINYQDAISIRAISSSFLPDWRPKQDYRNCYSAHHNMGGGVAIDLIHEWDYLTYFFGFPNNVLSFQDKISSLEIDSDDIAIYIAKFDGKTIELHLDYFGRKTMRCLDLLLPDDTIICDIFNGTITWLKQNRIINFNCERNNYQMKEIEHFFDIVDGKIQNDSDVEHAYKVLKLTKGIL